MTKTMASTKLDFMTVKPYLTGKNLLLLLFLVLFLTVINDGSAMLPLSMSMLYGSLFAGYPFIVGEKNNMDILFTTLSIKRGTVVSGRYMFALSLQFIVGVFAFAVSFIINSFMRRGFNLTENLYFLAALYVGFALIQCVQIPVYFKLGYTRAKMLDYILFVFVPLAVGFLPSLLKDYIPLDAVTGAVDGLLANPAVPVLIAAAVWLLALAVSYRLSLRFYMKKDF